MEVEASSCLRSSLGFAGTLSDSIVGEVSIGAVAIVPIVDINTQDGTVRCDDLPRSDKLGVVHRSSQH